MNSENEVVKPWFKNFFISWKNDALFLQYSNFQIISTFKVLTSWWVLICISMTSKLITTNDWTYLWIYIWNLKSFGREVWSTKIFQKSFARFGGRCPKSKRKHLWWVHSILVFWRCALRQSKIVNII